MLLLFLFVLYLLHALLCSFFFFFNDTATTEIYTLSLHDALPISPAATGPSWPGGRGARYPGADRCRSAGTRWPRSEEHTSELQSHLNLVCRLLLEKKKKKICKNRQHTRTSQIL